MTRIIRELIISGSVINDTSNDELTNVNQAEGLQSLKQFKKEMHTSNEFLMSILT